MCVPFKEDLLTLHAVKRLMSMVITIVMRGSLLHSIILV